MLAQAVAAFLLTPPVVWLPHLLLLEASEGGVVKKRNNKGDEGSPRMIEGTCHRDIVPHITHKNSQFNTN